MEAIIRQLIEEIKALRSELRQTSSQWLIDEGVTANAAQIISRSLLLRQVYKI